LSISEKPSKIKFLEKFKKIILVFYVKNGAERHLGHPRGTHHATTPHGGMARARPRYGIVWGLLALHLPLHQPFHSLSQNIFTP
jgi:hypothetical protein